MLWVLMPCCLVLESSRSLIGLGFFLQLLVRRMCVIGLILWYWLSGLLFLVLCIGQLLGLIWCRRGVSCLELLILYELWAGERLVLEKAVLCNRQPGRPI